MQSSSSNAVITPNFGRCNQNILCLAIDRLSADFLGAYGNAWSETPAFDALATESVLFDSFFATSLDLETLYRAFWRGESPAQIVASNAAPAESPDASPSLFALLKEKGYQTFIVSDVESVALHSAVEDDCCDGRFFLGAPDASRPAATLEKTKFFRNFEELARFVVKLEDAAKTAANPAPWFVWAHFSGWNENWDFPLGRRERFQEDEEDPVPYAATIVPFFPQFDDKNEKNSRLKPSNASEISPEISPKNVPQNVPNDDALELATAETSRLTQLDAIDRRQSVVEAYCGGVSVFDETLEGFVQLLKETGILDKTLLLTTATRGFPTGAPSALGVLPTPESSAALIFAPQKSRFYSEEVRLPLTIRLPNAVGATLRLPALCEPRDVFETLRAWPDFAPKLASPDFGRVETNEISPFAGKWSVETSPIADVAAATDSVQSEIFLERAAAFSASAPDVRGQNLLRLLADEDGVLRDRVLIVARDANSDERALVVDDWFLKESPQTVSLNNFAESNVDADPCSGRRLELFVLPDDRFNVNDVANRCVEIVEKLEPALHPNDERAEGAHLF